MAEPTTPELIRTACMRPSEAMLAVDDAQTSTPMAPTPVSMIHLYESQAFILVSTDVENHFADGQTAMLEITDMAPLALRERVRSLVWLNGTLHTIPAHVERDLAMEIATDHPDDNLLDLGFGLSLLRMDLTSAVLADARGAASVEPSELDTAEPDPFWELEPGWLGHLDDEHSDLVWQLSRRVPEELRDGRIRPLSIDRYGIGLRIESECGDHDIRLAFGQPVSNACELSNALRTLAGCPFLNQRR